MGSRGPPKEKKKRRMGWDKEEGKGEQKKRGGRGGEEECQERGGLSRNRPSLHQAADVTAQEMQRSWILVCCDLGLVCLVLASFPLAGS